jgi:flavin reductase (DIM6/NTAB) family NADH-FMN oxidoreductase RutF
MQSPSVSETLKATVGKALGRVPSGVYILVAPGAATDSPAEVVMVSWVQQAAFDPPAVSVAIARGRPAAEAVRRHARFTLSIVPQNDTKLMKKFARGVAPGADPFSGIDTRRSPAGLSVLADALGYLDCRLITTCDFSADHELFIAKVTAGEIFREGQSIAHQRGNGFHY